MNKQFRSLAVVVALSLSIGATVHAAGAKNDMPHVKIETNMGEIIVELNQKQAPKTVANFLKYTDDGFYNYTIFHRVIPGFMIQGGGFTPDYYIEKPTRSPIKNEADNGLRNERGTIAMARTSDPQSATAQFFINVNDNESLNFTSRTFSGWGYTVFGRVVEGMNVVDKIEHLPTRASGPFGSDVPTTTVVIKKVSRI